MPGRESGSFSKTSSNKLDGWKNAAIFHDRRRPAHYDNAPNKQHGIKEACPTACSPVLPTTKVFYRTIFANPKQTIHSPAEHVSASMQNY
jgi:hypothetical protein